MQYHLRTIGLRPGYTRFTQGISAVGIPDRTTSYFAIFLMASFVESLSWDNFWVATRE